MNDLLTVHDLQELLQVDRVTVYRMIKDGRLPAFKVGGQWRFSQPEIDAWLREQRAGLEVAGLSPATEEPPHVSHALPLSCVQAIQAIYAEALDIAAITTGPDGTPLTAISNSCAFCDLVLSTAEGRRRCAASWRPPAGGSHPPPLRTCHADLLCVSAPVLAGDQRIAGVVGCQFVAQTPTGEPDPAWLARLPTLATALGLEERDLRAAAGSVRALPPDQLARVPRLLQQVAVTFAEIGQERLKLIGRLQRIAEMTQV